MKIALVNKFLFENGGQESVLLEEARLLENAGHTVALWGMHHPRNLPDLPYATTFADFVDFSDPARDNGLIAKLKLAKQFISNQTAADRFEQFLNQFQPDVVHCHGIAHQLTPSILPVTKRHRLPVIYTLHDYQLICPSYTLLKGDGRICETVDCQQGRGYLPCIGNTCIKGSKTASLLNAVEMTFNAPKMLTHVDRFICPSHFMQNTMLGCGIPEAQLCYIPNCVLLPETNHFVRPLDVPEQYIIYAGRLSHEKGLRTLLQAMETLPELPLVIIGKGAEEQALKQYAKDLSHVHWLGFKPRAELMAYLAHAMAMVLPSEWYENAPMSIIEANLLGTPVVASDIGGLPEMIIPNETGWLFPSGDALGLEGVLRHIDQHPDMVTTFGKKAREQALFSYSPNSHLKALLDLYQSL